jgi:hypothetical protein
MTARWVLGDSPMGDGKKPERSPLAVGRPQKAVTRTAGPPGLREVSTGYCYRRTRRPRHDRRLPRYRESPSDGVGRLLETDGCCVRWEIPSSTTTKNPERTAESPQAVAGAAICSSTARSPTPGTGQSTRQTRRIPWSVPFATPFTRRTHGRLRRRQQGERTSRRVRVRRRRSWAGAPLFRLRPPPRSSPREWRNARGRARRECRDVP